jgi:membrane protease subunit HflK
MDLRDFNDAWNGRIDVGTLLQRNYPIIVLLLLVALLAPALLTTFYRVDTSDEGVVLRFGEHVRTSPPGLHWKLPWPIEEVYDVPVRRAQSLEFGFKTARAGRVTEYAPLDSEQLDVSEMLTGDLNLANVEWVVQYRVSDPVAYLFNLGAVEQIRFDALPAGVSYDSNIAVPDAIRDVSESVLRRLVGDTSVDAVLTFGREDIASAAKIEIQQMLDDFDAGLEIVTVKLQSTSPPEQVKDAFQEVNRARQNKERIVNEAEGERNRQIPAARGKRDKAISEAEGYAERILLSTKGEVTAYLAQLAEYEKAPEVTRRRIYLEAMEEILGQVGQKTILDESVDGLLPLLNLDPDGAASAAAKGGAR